MSISPIPMIPSFRHGDQTPWGGLALGNFHKRLPDRRTGESLEVSVLQGLESRSLQGQPLPQLIAQDPEGMLGSAKDAPFPLLLKLLNVHDRLSVQVHPDDAYAYEHENGKLGKTEAWMILDASESARIVYGVKPGVTRETLEIACSKGGDALQDCLNMQPLQAGEVYFIPAGMLHALIGDVVLLEIQQSSDVTYRLYDWDRLDTRGNPRTLHIRQGLDVVRCDLSLSPCKGIRKGDVTTYISDKAFTLQELHLSSHFILAPASSFRLLTALCDLTITGDFKPVHMLRGDSAFLPAALGSVMIQGNGSAILCCP